MIRTILLIVQIGLGFGFTAGLVMFIVRIQEKIEEWEKKEASE